MLSLTSLVNLPHKLHHAWIPDEAVLSLISFYKESLVLTYKCESFPYFLLEIKHCFFIKDLCLDSSARNMLPITIIDTNHKLLSVITIVVSNDIPFQHSQVPQWKPLLSSPTIIDRTAFLITFDSKVISSIICL